MLPDEFYCKLTLQVKYTHTYIPWMMRGCGMNHKYTKYTTLKRVKWGLG
jgi:hypothetical protein